MANKDKPAGFKPVGNLVTGGYNGQLRAYYCVLAATDDDMFVGTPVSMNTTAASATKGLAVGLQTVQKATASSDLVGVVVGIQIPDPYSERAYPGYLPKGKEGMVFVCDDPNTIFEVQSDAAIAAANVGGLFLTGVEDGSTVTGVSAQQLGANSADGNWRLVGFSQEIDNEFTEIHPKVHVVMYDFERTTA